MADALYVLSYFVVGFLLAASVGFIRGDSEDDEGYVAITVSTFLAWPLLIAAVILLLIPHAAGELGQYVARTLEARRQLATPEEDPNA